MKILVFGAGPIGRRHARNALELGHEAAIVRASAGDAVELDGGAVVPVLSLAGAETWGPDAVVVASPPSAHLASAAWAVERGCPVLVEKPLAAGPEGVDELLDAAARRGVHVATGYNLRFHPALAAVAAAVAAGRIGRVLVARAEVGAHMPSWHPDRDYRATSPARRDQGGGALLTSSHELDYMLWICGPAELVAGARAKVSAIEMDADDTADLILAHTSGTRSSIHLDFVDRSYNRRSRWVGETGSIAWEWGGPVRLQGDGVDEVLWEDAGFDLGATYVDELAAFLDGRPAPGDALADARRVLELAAAVEWR